MRNRALLILILLAATALPAQAQLGVPTPTTPGLGEILSDRVIAIVGDTALLRSDLDWEINQYRSAGTLPQDSAALVITP